MPGYEPPYDYDGDVDDGDAAGSSALAAIVERDPLFLSVPEAPSEQALIDAYQKGSALRGDDECMPLV